MRKRFLSTRFMILFLTFSCIFLGVLWLIVLPMKFNEIKEFIGIISTMPEDYWLAFTGHKFRLPDLSEIAYIKAAYYISLVWIFVMIIMFGFYLNQGHKQVHKKEITIYYQMRRMILEIETIIKPDAYHETNKMLNDLLYELDYTHDFGFYSNDVCKIENQIFDEICLLYQNVKQTKINQSKVEIQLKNIFNLLNERRDMLK